MSLSSERRHRLAAETERRATAEHRRQLRAAAQHPDPEMNQPQVVNGPAWEEGLATRLAAHGFTMDDWRRASES